MKMQTVKTKTTEWFKKNILTLLYFIFAIAIEMIGVWTVEGSPFLSRPFISLGLLLLICGIVKTIDSDLVKLIVYACLLAVQAVVDLVFAVIFDMTEQYFDFGMFKLRNDAFGTLENIPVNFITFYAGFFFVVLFIVYGLRKIKNRPVVKKTRRSVWFYVGLMVSGLAVTATSLVAYNPTATNKYKEMIDGKAKGAYASYGMVGNFVNEMAKATIFTDWEKKSVAEMDGFLYAEQSTPTEYFGVAKDKNVVVVLVESFEWFSFLNDDQSWNEGEYPNGLNLSNEARARLFPNVTDFYNKSLVMTNFHSREKTDISETFSIMGAYPTGAYVNYDYDENTLPHTLPNLLKSFDEDIQCRSFHNGWKTFYNRDGIHKKFGFESAIVDGEKLASPIDMHDMEAMSNAGEAQGKDPTMTNYYDEAGERNLDSEMIETCKDLMFPTDKRFCTYITTITMHGMYYERDNLADKYAALKAEYVAENNPELDEEGNIVFADESERVLFNYMTTVMEFDYALECMMTDLKTKNLLDNTTVVLFGDHNTYYQELSGYTKDIYDYDEEDQNFTDLYSVPFMIYDSDLQAQLTESERFIDKFTCTADIMPTLMDLLGINYYTNMYYGNSVFSQKKSVLYSRAYDVFIGDGIVGKSVNNPLYVNDNVTVGYFNSYKTEAKALVKEIEYYDNLFRQDYFGNRKNYNTFQTKIKEINPNL